MRNHIHLTLLILVLGTGFPVTASALSISASQLDFGNQFVGQVSALQSVTLTNDGAAPVTILGLSIIGAHPADFIVFADLNSALGPGTSRRLDAWFMPTAAGGRTAEVLVSGEDATTLATLQLSGVGVVPEPAVGILLILGLVSLVPWRDRLAPGRCRPTPCAGSTSSWSACIAAAMRSIARTAPGRASA